MRKIFSNLLVFNFFSIFFYIFSIFNSIVIIFFSTIFFTFTRKNSCHFERQPNMYELISLLHQPLPPISRTSKQFEKNFKDFRQNKKKKKYGTKTNQINELELAKKLFRRRNFFSRSKYQISCES